MNYYRRYMGDFQADTMSLSMMEQGAYDRLLDYYYATERPIPIDDGRAAIICRAVTEAERTAVAFVLKAYFTREEDGWHNARADREIAAAGSARANGRFGGRPRKTEAETDAETGSETGHETEDETKTITGSGHPPTTNHQPPTTSLQPPATKGKSRKRASTPLPADFAVSERVATWAKRNGFDRLDEHLEVFKRKAEAKGYAYASWDAAFMEAVREDWAGLRSGPGRGAGRESVAEHNRRVAEEAKRERAARESA